LILLRQQLSWLVCGDTRSLLRFSHLLYLLWLARRGQWFLSILFRLLDLHDFFLDLLLSTATVDLFLPFPAFFELFLGFLQLSVLYLLLLPGFFVLSHLYPLFEVFAFCYSVVVYFFEGNGGNQPLWKVHFGGLGPNLRNRNLACMGFRVSILVWHIDIRFNWLWDVGLLGRVNFFGCWHLRWLRLVLFSISHDFIQGLLIRRVILSFRFLFCLARVVASVVYQNFDYFGFVNKVLQIHILQHLRHDVGFYLLKVTAAVFDPHVNLLQQCEDAHIERLLAQPFRNVALAWDVKAICAYSANGAQYFNRDYTYLY